MARRPVAFKVGGDAFEVIPLGTSEGTALAHKMLHTIGAVVGELYLAPRNPGVSTDEWLTGVLGGAVHHFTPQLRLELEATFQKCTKVQAGQLMLDLAPIYEDHFAQRYDVWLGWLVECCVLNFSSFFSSSASSSVKKFGGLAKAAMGQAETPTS
jgi:hypothetical protein